MSTRRASKLTIALWFLMPRRDGFFLRAIPALAGYVLFVWIAAPVGPATNALSAILAWIVYEGAIYQSRYLVNDALGYGEDRKVYGPFRVNRVPLGFSKKQVWVAVIIRSTLALLLLASVFSSRPLVESVAVGAMFVSVVGYEIIRQHYRSANSIPVTLHRTLLELLPFGITGYAARALWSLSVAASLLSRNLTAEVYITAVGFMSCIGILAFVFSWAGNATLFTTKLKRGYRVPVLLADRPHVVAALALFLNGPIEIKGDTIPDHPLDVFKRIRLPKLLRADFILATALAATCGAAIGQTVPLLPAMVIGLGIGIILCVRPLIAWIAVVLSLIAVIALSVPYGWQSGITTIGVALVPYFILFGLMTANYRSLMKQLSVGGSR